MSLIKITPQAREKGQKRDRLYEFSGVDIEKITKTNLIMIFKDREWLRKVRLERENDYIIWRYPEVFPIYIKRDGFYVGEEDYNNNELKVLQQRIWLVFSVLRQAKMILYD